MSKWLMGGIGCLVVVGIFLVITVIWGIGVCNNEARLRNQIEAKQKDNTNEYDGMWKKISQVAQVTDAQKNALKEIFVEHAQARSTGGGGSLMKWVQESVPHVDTSTFNNLMNIITASRDSFVHRQKELLDLKREHDNLLSVIPGGILLSALGRQKIDVTIVTSSRTEAAFKTGKDDDVNVFNKPAPVRAEK